MYSDRISFENVWERKKSATDWEFVELWKIEFCEKLSFFGSRFNVPLTILHTGFYLFNQGLYSRPPLSIYICPETTFTALFNLSWPSILYKSVFCPFFRAVVSSLIDPEIHLDPWANKRPFKASLQIQFGLPQGQLFPIKHAAFFQGQPPVPFKIAFSSLF